MTTIKQAIASADTINVALLDAKNALDAIYAPDPGSPVERVLQGDRRGERIAQIMCELGTALRQTGYGHYAAHGLFGTVRVVRGPRAESVWQNQDGAMRWKTVAIGGQPDHVEVEVDVANASKKGNTTQ